MLEGESTKIPMPSDVDHAAAERARKQAAEDGIVVSNGKRSIAVQTLYRESEAQTDAYTPDYVLAPGMREPEVLGIAHLTGEWLVQHRVCSLYPLPLSCLVNQCGCGQMSAGISSLVYAYILL